ncbi:excalibur calcium-binding domain-containing protein [Nonomuraea sp. NPDC050783]|uniref:excalibur calcium-binding domain-containing protein n=1 Tax=Nonomuraea sp. NPDC050783 TaxID=3154634 RepID=UPI003465009E
MDKPEAPPPADPGEPQASRVTTIVLIVSLVLVVLIAGVLGTVAVLMTKNPDQPLLGGAPPVRLAVPLHFAPVREVKAAPCQAGEQAVPDEEQRTCYVLEDGVTVLSVQRIEPVREKDGQYSVRIAVAAGFKDRMVELVDELAPDQRQLAVVLAPEQPDAPKTVVAAPIVTEQMDGDSLRIAGFTKEQADALTSRLLGPVASGAPTGAPTGGPAGTPTSAPTGVQPPGTGNTQPGTGNTQPGTGSTQPGTGNTQPGTGNTQPGTGNTPPGTGTTNTQPGTTNPASGTGRSGTDPRYGSCKEAVAHGYGPYSRGVHEEYSWYTDTDGNGVACNSGDMS